MNHLACACADVPEMPGNVTVKEVTESTVLMSADSPPAKPVIEHGGLDVISWVVTYQAESDDGAPIGREFTAMFSNGMLCKFLLYYSVYSYHIQGKLDRIVSDVDVTFNILLTLTLCFHLFIIFPIN